MPSASSLIAQRAKLATPSAAKKPSKPSSKTQE